MLSGARVARHGAVCASCSLSLWIPNCGSNLHHCTSYISLHPFHPSQQAPPATPALESLHPLVLGYTAAAVTFQQAGSSLFEALFTAPDGSSRLAWLSNLVQGLEALASLSLELQLVGPALLSLAASQHAQQIASSLMDARAAAAQSPGLGQEAQQALEQLAAQFPPLGSALHLLQAVHATAQQLREAAGVSAHEPASPALQPSQQLWLAQAAGTLWDAVAAVAEAIESSGPLEVEGATAGGVAAVGGPEAAAAAVTQASAAEAAAPAAAQPAEAAGGRAGPQKQLPLAAWEACSKAVAAIVDGEVAQQVLPAAQVSFLAAAAAFHDAVAAAQQAGGGGGGGPAGEHGGRRGQAAPAQQAQQHAELVPFTDFDTSLAGELLEELESGGELGGIAERSGLSQPGLHEDDGLERFARFGAGLDSQRSEGEGEGELLGAHATADMGHSRRSTAAAAEAPPGAEARRGSGGAAAAAAQSPELVPFTDFDDSLEGLAGGLLEPLEEGPSFGATPPGGSQWDSYTQVSDTAPRSQSQYTGSRVLSQQQQQRQASQHSQGSGDGDGGAEQLQQWLAALAGCAGASGALAAADSQLYLLGRPREV